MLHLLSITAFLVLVRVIVWFLGGFVQGFSTAAAFVFGLLGAAWISRLLLVDVESTAEGSDEFPALPDPREVEELFGSLLRLVGVGFFTLLPLFFAGILNLADGAVARILLVVGALYTPAALLAVAVKGEIAGCFPGPVGAIIRGARARYLFPAALSAGIALLLEYSHAGGGARASLILELAMDVGAAWLCLALLHAVGLIHREVPAVAEAVPFPPPAPSITERTAPPRPPTEIERILADRLRREAGNPPPEA
jgi:hypothetical protein